MRRTTGGIAIGEIASEENTPHACGTGNPAREIGYHETMDVVRRISLLVTATLLGIALMLGGISTRPAVSADVSKELDRATAFFDSTIVLARGAQPQGPRGDQLAIALGYLERLRLGLGSPFRLADEALTDPRLSASMENRVAWALLGRLRRGEAYVVDPVVLDDIGPWTADGRAATGNQHLAVIERAIGAASDPRAGELAVRLAYSIAAAKGNVTQAGVVAATDVAALLRDRASSEADLRDLLAEASEHRSDVLELLQDRRDARTFRTERPGLAPLGSSLQLEAMRAVPALLQAIDTLAQAVAPANPSARATWPVIGSHFARRLVALGRERPPVAQVVVTLGGFSHALSDATNEETLTGASVDGLLGADSVRRGASLAMLSTAVAIRTLAQSDPWFPGMDGPTVTDLIDEFGLAGISFSRSVPLVWRPFYARELETGLQDMQRVFPVQTFAGLRVQFGTDALRDSALALHDPRTRTLQLSIATSGGTIAHELSHDVDWQASRRMFASGGGYSTDRVVREKSGALASSMRGLAEARPFRTFSGAGTAPPVDRPAELFARGADWFVASVLAQQGRMNGFLSAIGDGSLPGYAAGAPTAVGFAGTTSLASAIGAIVYVPDSIRAVFESAWSDPRTIDPMLLVRRVLDTPISWRSVWQWSAGMDSLLSSASIGLCTADDSPELRARKNLLMLAVDARARGMAQRRARFSASAQGTAWANGIVGAIPWSSSAGDRIVDGLRSAIVAALTTTLSDQGVVPVIPPTFRSSAANCSSIAR
jgi:hypothetical protein